MFVKRNSEFSLDLRATDVLLSVLINSIGLCKYFPIPIQELTDTIMNQIPVERRQQPRFKVAEGVFAALVNHTSKLGQIRDISKIGLAFRYIDHGDESEETIELKIIIGSGGVYLDNLPFRKVSDFEIKNEHSFSSLKMRQIGLQFGELTQEQLTRLEQFIENHTIGEA
jgi:hypothetical protein